MNQLIPAILVQDEQTFRSRLKLVENLVPVIHLDVMDGAFVPNRTWFDPHVLASLETPVQIELHLMVNDPARVIDEVAQIESIIRTIWHIEAPIDHTSLIRHVVQINKEPALAISPKTPIDTLALHANAIKEILVMGGEPGRSGQELEPHTIERAWEIHGRWPELPLGFDIGVNTKTIQELKRAGVSRFCAASAIFETKDPVAAIQELQSLL